MPYLYELNTHRGLSGSKTGGGDTGSIVFANKHGANDRRRVKLTKVQSTVASVYFLCQMAVTSRSNVIMYSYKAITNWPRNLSIFSRLLL